MDKTEIRTLYGRMVKAQRKEETDEEFGAWVSVLGVFPASDLDAACRRWVADTYVEEWTGKTRGSRMPSVSELKRSIEIFRNAHTAHFVGCGHCEEGWLRTFEGQTLGTFGDGRHTKSPVDAKLGALKRCPCFIEWAAKNRKTA